MKIETSKSFEPLKALIIGGAGFVGGYLSEYLKNNSDFQVYVTKLGKEKTAFFENSVKVCDLDIIDADAVKKLIENIKPDCIFHLAAQSSVFLSWKNPSLTVDVNIKGTINILEAIRSIPNYNPKILLVGSGEEYGHIKENEIPLSEENLLRPANMYAVTKACQNFMGKIYCDAYNMNIVSVRAFNHIGPKQSPDFVVSDFCKQAVQIEKGLKENIIKTGNLSAKRDFTDVRDVVRAYYMLIRNGKSGETYNVGSGKAVSVETVLNMIIQNSNVDICVETDPNKLRPVDVPIIQADISKITRDVGWTPKIPLETTVYDTLRYWRGI